MAESRKVHDDGDAHDHEHDHDEENEESEEITDLRDPNVLTKYKSAAEIVNKALLGVKQYLKAGKKVVEVCTFGDTLISKQCEAIFKNKKIEKGVAFPTCISINNCVGHFTPLVSEEPIELKQGDVVKVDMAAHIDGFVAAAAHTFVISQEDGNDVVTGKTADVILAAYNAAEAAVKMIKPGQTNTAVTAMLKDVANSYGVSNVQGVLMHQMKKFVIDGNQVILNREEVDQTVDEFQFEDYTVYAVDVVMSTGEGKPIERDSRTTVYKRAIDQNYSLKMKSSRYLLNEVSKRFPTFPFTLRSVDEKQGRLGVTECLKHGLLTPYPVLYEKPGEIVAHFKFTVLLLPNGTTNVTNLVTLDASKVVSDKEPSQQVKEILASSTKRKKKANKKKKKASGDKDASAATTDAKQ